MEKFNERKKGKGLMVLALVLSLLLGFTIGYIYYDKFLSVNDNQLKEIEKKYKDLEVKYNGLKNDSDFIDDRSVDESIYIDYTHHENYKIYAIGVSQRIIGYNGELYLIENESGKNIDYSLCVSGLEDGTFKFTDKDRYNCSDTSSEGGTYIIKLNVKEDDVYKVKIYDRFASTDAQYDIFVIYKSGKVERYGYANKDDVLVMFKDYKVKDVEEFCYKKNEFGCSAGYKLVLQDGTIKTVTE